MDEHKAAVSLMASVAGSTTWLVTANEVIQAFAGIVAIISGLAALRYYLKKQ